MAGRRAEIPVEKIALNLGKGDFARMGELFPNLGGGKAIRTLVRNFIRRVESATPALDISINPSDIEELNNDERDSSERV